MGWPKIELRLSDVEPPDPDIPKTIYRDRFNLPDPMLLGLTARYYNWDDIQLYFRVTGSGPGYTFGTVNLGALVSGANAYINLDQFASRPKPSGEVEEEITLILRAYTDAGYTTLRWTYERVVHVKIIDSNDPSYTVDVLNNFDDGTVQGWAAANEQGNMAGKPTVVVVDDYVLSAPYSLRMEAQAATTGIGEVRSRLYKSFTTPDKNNVFAIIEYRQGQETATTYYKYNAVQRNGTTLVFLGRPYAATAESFVPKNKWMRIVVSLPRNTTLEIRIILDHYSPGSTALVRLVIDDFRIISKD